MKSLGIIFILFFSLGSISFAQTYASKETLSFEALDREALPLNLREVRMKMKYPKWAVQAGIEGKIVVGVQVDEKGNYVSHKILSIVHPGLLEIVQKHLVDLQFSPAQKSGIPVSSWISIPFSFKIVTPLEQNIREAKDILYLKKQKSAKELISTRP